MDDTRKLLLRMSQEDPSGSRAVRLRKFHLWMGPRSLYRPLSLNPFPALPRPSRQPRFSYVFIMVVTWVRAVMMCSAVVILWVPLSLCRPFGIGMAV